MFSKSIADVVTAGNGTPADRRQFLKLGVGAGVGLTLGVWLPGETATAHAGPAAAGGGQVFNPFVRITPDNKVNVLSKHLDKGQGVVTGLATLVAEELDAAWEQMVPEFAPADTAVYKNLAFGVQGTGGSTSIANSFEQYRKAGAAARQMIIAAAAARWGVAATIVAISAGVVTDGTHKATLGELAEAAAKLPVPEQPKLKDAKNFVYIGKSFARLDQVAKTTGQPIYTQDVHLPGMLVAVLARPTRFGGVVKSFDASAARKVAGVVDVVQVPQGVAVVAKSTWSAIRAREALKIEWDDEKADKRGSDALVAEYRRLAATKGAVARAVGDAEAALANAQKVIEAEFVFPFLAHAPMEPMNCVMKLEGGVCTIWSGSQMQTVDQMVTAAILGLKPENVVINTLWAGGSFGRRAVPSADYVAETAAIVKAFGKPLPIKLVWTREDDIKGGYYRPMYLHTMRAGVDGQGKVVGWQHRIVGQSIMAGTAFEKVLVKDGIDHTSVEGAVNAPYDVGSFQLELHSTKVGVPPLWWRSVGSSHTAYVVETMIDELASLAGQDPVAFRLALLGDKHPRHAAVLKLAAEKAGWGSPLAPGVARGIALHESFNSFVAEVAEVRIENGKPRVERVVCAVDCGLAINPDNIKAQMEGGIGYGLGAVLHSKVTLKDGMVEQSNFDDYEVLRMDEMPRVEVHIVASAEAPTGVGEPGVPPIGPAVANAVAALTGKRVRVLPIGDQLKG
jgi:isoquinoline 1-oxidoreductase beta subunit